MRRKDRRSEDTDFLLASSESKFEVCSSSPRSLAATAIEEGTDMAPLSSSTSLSPSSCSVTEMAPLWSLATRAWQQMKQLFFRMFQPNHEVDLFMLVNHFPARPIAYSLYSVTVSYASSPPHLPPDIDVTSPSVFSSRDAIKPILKIPEQFPENMCCVQLNSKVYFLGGIVNGISPPDVYVLDTSDIDGDCSRNYHRLLLSKNVAGRLLNGKARPYAFVVKNKIFVINNHRNSYESDFSFEVFSPLKKRRKNKPSRKLPDPPIDLIVEAHVVVGDKLFLSGRAIEGIPNVVVCLHLINGYKWVKSFVHGYLDDHKFYWEGYMLGETMYALSDMAAMPGAYNLNPERVKRNLSECRAMNKECRDRETYATELFEDRALLSPSILEAVHNRVGYLWLENRLLHLGDGTFCYLSAGEFPLPHESRRRPRYFGVNLTFFKPSEGTFTEVISGIKDKSFGGHFLSFAHLKLHNITSSSDIRAQQGCFFVPSDKICQLLTWN